MEATHFLERFLQKYKKIKDFAQTVIGQCHSAGKPAAARPLLLKQTVVSIAPHFVAKWMDRQMSVLWFVYDLVKLGGGV